MRGIIAKNWAYYLVIIIIVGYPSIYEATSGVNNPLAFSKLLGVLLYFSCLVPALMIETQEEKFKGYNFLASLPVTVKETVLAKSAMFIAAVVLVAVYDIVLLHSLAAGPAITAKGINVIAFNSAVCLLLGGALYYVTFRFSVVYVMTAIFSLTLVANLATFFMFKKGGAFFGRIVSGGAWIENMSAPLAIAVLLAGAGLNYALIRRAVRLKESRRMA